MPKFRVYRSVGWIANSASEDVIEADTQEDAAEWAREWCLQDVEYGAAPLDDEETAE